MASITRAQAEKNITLAFTQYLDALSKARKNKEKLPPEAMPLFDGMDKFRSFVKSPDLQQKVFNRLSLQGIQELHNGCSILAELYALSCSASLKNMTVTEDSPAGMITSNAEHFSAGGSYLFNLENLGNRTKKPGEFFLPSWNCYRLDTVSGKYGLYKEGLSEQRALLDTDSRNRTFLFREAGTYKITASIFKEGFSPVPELVEVREHVIQVFDDSDADIAGLPPEKKILLAIQYSSLRDTLKNIGLDVVAVAASIALFAGIAFVLNKLSAGKLRPFLLKIAKELGLAELMSFIGTAGDVFSFTALVASTCTFWEQAVNAQNRKQLEDAGETFEKAAEALGLVLVFRGIDLIGRSLGRNTKAVEDRIRAEQRAQKPLNHQDAVGKYASEVDKIEGYTKVTPKDGTPYFRRSDPDSGLPQLTVRNDVIIYANKSIGKIIPVTGKTFRDVANIIPPSYAARAKEALASKSAAEQERIVQCIQKLYNEGGPGKTMQEHHWIEQSAIKNVEKYPFLQSPPLDIDLYTSKENLSLIVGHNGSHKSSYNDMLNKELKTIRDYITDYFNNNKFTLEQLVNETERNQKLKEEISSRIMQTIEKLHDEVERNPGIMNNAEEMHILD